MRAVSSLKGLACAAALLGAVVVSTAAAGTIDLRTEPGITITGFSDTSSGSSPVVAAAGDVNGDGLPDVIFGSPGEDQNGREDSGSAYVVFGQTALTSFDVRNLGSNGFRIDGAASRDRAGLAEADGDGAGAAVAAAGDVNADGLGDLIVGAPHTANNGRRTSGSVYVILGKRSTDPIDLARLGSQGYRVDGPRQYEPIGNDIANAGDVNGDGRPDLIVASTPFPAPGKVPAWIVFAQAGGETINLRRLANKGYAILSGSRIPRHVTDVARAGDVNGDGRSDVVLGAFAARREGEERPTKAYVLYGQGQNRPVELAKLGHRGYVISGPGGVGHSVAGAGDFNGDGRPDLILGSSRPQFSRGAAFVVFGQARQSSINLRKQGGGGLLIRGAQQDDNVGGTVAGAGDVNGDGLADVVLGASGLSPDCRLEPGAAYVVFGRRQPGTVSLGNLGAQGLLIEGPRSLDNAGATVDGIGDINGDGLPDVVMGAPAFNLSEPEPIFHSAYIAFGRKAASERAPLAGPCLTVRPLETRLGEILKTRTLPVEVSAREVDPDLLKTVYVAAQLPQRPHRRTGMTVAYGTGRLGAGGTVTFNLRIRKRGRRFLAKRKTVRLELFAFQGIVEGPANGGRTVVTISR